MARQSSKDGTEHFTEFIGILLTPSQRAKLADRAQQEARSESGLVRWVALQYLDGKLVQDVTAQ